MGSDGEFAEILFMPGGGSRCPITIENIGQQLNTIKMQGKETYKQAVTAMSDAADRALEAAGLKYDEIACVIPHQANMRIIEAIAHRMRLPIEKFYVNLEKYGNTSAAAVAIALDEAHRAGRFKVGDYILLVVFGGGLTWASSVIQW
jgi:3-oxoacyl-[acyl-carrier-protein] synthase-3